MFPGSQEESEPGSNWSQWIFTQSKLLRLQNSRFCFFFFFFSEHRSKSDLLGGKLGFNKAGNSGRWEKSSQSIPNLICSQENWDLINLGIQGSGKSHPKESSSKTTKKSVEFEEYYPGFSHLAALKKPKIPSWIMGPKRTQINPKRTLKTPK